MSLTLTVPPAARTTRDEPREARTEVAAAAALPPRRSGEAVEERRRCCCCVVVDVANVDVARSTCLVDSFDRYE